MTSPLDLAMNQFAATGYLPGPSSSGGVRLYSAKCKSGMAVGRFGSITHRVAAMAVVYIDGVARFSARWVCGNGSADVVIQPADVASEICVNCMDANTPIVYRCFGSDGGLLYIGCTIAKSSRFRAHERLTKWWSEVTKIETVEYAEVTGARVAERHAIRTEHPRYNRMHRALAATSDS